jgi:hypothetical protein
MLQPPLRTPAVRPGRTLPGPTPRSAARHGHAAARPHAAPDGISVDWLIIALTCLALALMNTVPSNLLTWLKIHYVTTGGNFLEKFHPATYVFVLAFLLTLLRDSAPVRELERMISDAPLVLIYAFSIVLLFIQSVMLHRPVTSSVDTFLLPLIAFFIISSLTPQQKTPLVWTLHGLMLVNITLGYFEFLSGHRIIPLAVNDVVLTNEWRSTALFGHPLIASGLVGAYTLALILRRDLIPSTFRIPVILFCLGSLFVFGGRTALVLVMAGIGLLTFWSSVHLVRGARIPLPLVIAGICGVFLVAAGVFTLFDVGFLDKMLLRFSSDRGSAYARLESLQLLMSFDWHELLLGADAARVDSLQTMLGLQVGIEDFWIACIAQYGLVHTVLLTIGLACFFAEVLWRSRPAARALVVFLIIIAASSVSFSSKGVKLTQHITLMLLLLPRERMVRASAPAKPGRVGRFEPQNV